jgi:hypothetical protein
LDSTDQAFLLASIEKFSAGVFCFFLTAKRKSPLGGGEPRQGRAKAKNNQLPTSFILVFIK